VIGPPCSESPAFKQIQERKNPEAGDDLKNHSREGLFPIKKLHLHP
jgi:hypothetical protein